jgi:hypothetical protein
VEGGDDWAEGLIINSQPASRHLELRFLKFFSFRNCAAQPVKFVWSSRLADASSPLRVPSEF